LPFSDHQPANTAPSNESFPRGRIEVTPVRYRPFADLQLPSPEISVVWPTVTPGTSVMALNGPGVHQRARQDRVLVVLAAFFPAGKKDIAIRTEANSKAKSGN